MRRLGLAAFLLTLLAVGPARAAVTRQAKLSRVLTRQLRSAGGHSGAYVLDLTTGRPLFSSHAGTGRIPASVEKLYTTTAALLRFGPSARLTTSVVGSGSISPSGVFTGTLYLKGGGDPTFGSANFDRSYYGTGATMRQLVTNLRQASGISAIRGSIEGDESYFDSRRGTVATAYAPSSWVEGELSALAYNRGYLGSAFQSRPALYAAQQFANALRNQGVRVPKGVRVGTRHATPAAQLLGEVHSPRIATLMHLTDTPSDNYLAEMLLKGLGARFGSAGTSAAGAAVVRHQMASSFGIHPRLDDGSGLSRHDRTSPRQVVTLLRSMAASQPFNRALAVAGETGTMRYEMVGTRGAGNCRGKTGTLHDVASLVGYCSARDGHQLAFAFLMNGLADANAGHAIEDKMGVTLANYNG